MTAHALVAAGALGMALAAAQPQPVAISVETNDSTAGRIIARLDNDRWVAPVDDACLAGNAGRRVVSTGIALSAPVRVAPQSAEAKSLPPVVDRLFQQRQAEHGLIAANLDGHPVTLDWLYRIADGGATLYYFEASRRIPDPGTAPDEDPKGTLRVAVSGWLRARAGGSVVPVGSKSELRWEQDPENGAPSNVPAPDLTPLAVAQQPRSVWIMHARIGRTDRFTLYEVGDSGIRELVKTIIPRCAQVSGRPVGGRQ